MTIEVGEFTFSTNATCPSGAALVEPYQATLPTAGVAFTVSLTARARAAQSTALPQRPWPPKELVNATWSRRFTS